mmetsp:Transcript_16738/g.40802  ORF Transcript_16738/g.40802 Transcript_16738/m.40802 type:complete len:242 (+) Transcript_16738:37-762(+)
MPFESVAAYYNHVLTSDDYDQEDFERLFPQLATLQRVFPDLERALELNASIPFEVCMRVADYSGGPCILNVDDSGSHCRGYVTDTTCESGGCNWNCISCARSEQSLQHMQYFKIRPMQYFKLRPIRQQVGIGFTLNPKGRSGFRFNNESCGFYLDAKTFFFGRDEAGKERSIAISNRLTRMPNDNNSHTMELAIDYVNQQVLLKWPRKGGEPLRLDLPEHMRNRLLFPLVQAWHGCSLTVV